MILSDKTLMKMIENKELIVEPLEKEQIQPASVDIRLGNTFSIVEDTSTGIINLENEIKYKTITTDSYILLPNQFVLATTMEYFDLPDDLAAKLELDLGISHGAQCFLLAIATPLLDCFANDDEVTDNIGSIKGYARTGSADSFINVTQSMQVTIDKIYETLMMIFTFVFRGVDYIKG